MLSRPTTFVLGAGASCDLKLPTGDGLQDCIASILQLTGTARRFANDRIWRALQYYFDGNNWAERASTFALAASKIVRGMSAAASIDNFLHTHRDNDDIVLLGKLAIALAILEAEANSPLRTIDKDSFRAPASSYRKAWYFPFVRMLTMGTLSSDPHALFTNVRFVVFNYDRCLELVLLHAIQDYYGLDDQAAAEVLSKVDIVHPYGSIGDLTSSREGGVPFGYGDADLLKVSRGIRTFTESVETATMERARAAVAEADVLIFLGFGFLPQNMDLLVPGDERKATRVHATTHGFSETDKLVIKDRLMQFVRPADRFDLGEIQFVDHASAFSGFIDVENGTCCDLIANHRMRLTKG